MAVDKSHHILHDLSQLICWAIPLIFYKRMAKSWGQGTPILTQQGCFSEILKRTLRGTKILFCGHGLKNQLIFKYLVIFFQLNTLKGTAKAPAVDLLRLNTLRGTKTTFLTSKRYD